MSTESQSDGVLHVLGGGPAGMALLHYAVRAGLNPRVYEAAGYVGGNARTIQWGDFRFDSGAHRLHHKDARSMQDFAEILGSDMLVVDTPSQIWLEDRFLDFPLAPLDLLRRLPSKLLFKIVRENLLPQALRPKGESFQTRAIRAYGPTLANKVLLNYSYKLWGVDLDDLDSSAAGGRLKGLDLRTFIVEGLRGSRAKTRHLDGQFHYPRLGIGQLFDNILKQSGPERVNLGSRVAAIFHDEKAISGFELESGERITCSALCSTLPAGLMVKLLQPVAPQHVLHAAANLTFRHMRLLVLAIDRPCFSPNASVYVPAKDVKFTRIYESKNRSAAMAPADKTSIVIEYPCFAGERAWQCSEAQLINHGIRTLVDLGLLRRAEVLDATSLKLYNAYPVPQISSQQDLNIVREYLHSIRGLNIIGRGAEFKYTHIHDLFKSARDFIDESLHSYGQTATAKQ